MPSTASPAVRLAPPASGRPLIRGFAVPYGKLSHPLPILDGAGRRIGTFRERFAPGAFASDLPTADVRFLINHDRNLVFGRTRSGTLRLIDTPEGLRFEADPPNTAIARHYMAAIARRDMTGASFRFYVEDFRVVYEAGVEVREVRRARIDDVSVVTYPAYPDSRVEVRSAEATPARSSTPRLDAARRRHRLRCYA